MAHPPRISAVSRPDRRAATRQVLVIALLGGILLVVMGILVVLLLGLPGRLAPAPHPQRQNAEATAPSPPWPAQTSATAAAAAAPATRGHAADSLPRSPIPEPGEVVTAAIPARRLDGPGRLSAPAAAGQEVVPWNTAARYLGKEVTIEGKIVETHRSGKVCFLNFSHDRDAFYLIMFEKTLKSWPEAPEVYFRGKTIRARGKVEMHGQRPQIQIEDAAQIIVVE
jgi:hypothetical protein